MKRRMVGAGGVVLVIALLAIGAWWVMHTRSTAAEMSRFDAEYERRKQPASVSFIVSVPPSTPADQTLYLSGSVPALGNWDAAGVPLKRQEDGKYVATVAELLNDMEYEFKVTRGTWGTVEADEKNQQIDNHTFTASDNAKVEVAVAEWIDNGKAVPGRVTMTPGVRLEKKFQSKALGNERTLIVYVPPDYDAQTSQRYPVLYLQDGQNLMDEATSFQGIEWGIDEAAQKLIGSGAIEPLIIVGIYNTETRTAEFTPPLESVDKSKAQGDAYAKMVVEEIKPFIDQKYRTRPQREHTLIGGGSMGGLITMYTAKVYPNVFGHVIALSPHLRVNEKPIAVELVGDGAWLKNTRVYVDMGTEPGHNYPGGAETALQDAQNFIAALEQAGATPQYVEIEGGKHNEASWAATIEPVLMAVLGKTAAATQRSE